MGGTAHIDPEDLAVAAQGLTTSGTELQSFWKIEAGEIDANQAGIGGYDILSAAFRNGYREEVVTKTRALGDAVPGRFIELGDVGRLAAQEHRDHQDRATQSFPR